MEKKTRSIYVCPVKLLETWIAVETIVDTRNSGPPHQNHNA